MLYMPVARLCLYSVHRTVATYLSCQHHDIPGKACQSVVARAPLAVTALSLLYRDSLVASSFFASFYPLDSAQQEINTSHCFDLLKEFWSIRRRTHAAASSSSPRRALVPHARLYPTIQCLHCSHSNTCQRRLRHQKVSGLRN